MNCPVFPKIDTLYERGGDFKVDVDRVRRPEFKIPREWFVTEKVHGCNVRVSLELACPQPHQGAYTICDHGGDPANWVMRFNGRKENSQMPTLLVAHLQDTFTLEGLRSLWRCKKNCEKCQGRHGEIAMGTEKDSTLLKVGLIACPNLEPYPITLYGEGYGGGIQKGGGGYTSKTKGGAASFRLFDVLVGETWLRRADVEDVAAKLGIKCVPLIQLSSADGDTSWNLESITEFVKRGFDSFVAYEEGTEGHPAEGIVAFTKEPLFNGRGQRLMFKLKTADFA